MNQEEQIWFPAKYQNRDINYKITKTGLMKTNWHKYKDKILKGSINCWGYRTVMIKIDDKHRHRFLHTVLASTFLPLPEGYDYSELTVNHKDGNKLNNSLDNLEWCTFKANQLHRFDLFLQKKTRGNVDHNVYLFRNDDGREFIGSARELYHTYKESDNLWQQGIRSMLRGFNNTNGHKVTVHKGWRKKELITEIDPRMTDPRIFYKPIPELKNN